MKDVWCVFKTLFWLKSVLKWVIRLDKCYYIDRVPRLQCISPMKDVECVFKTLLVEICLKTTFGKWVRRLEKHN